TSRNGVSHIRTTGWRSSRRSLWRSSRASKSSGTLFRVPASLAGRRTWNSFRKSYWCSSCSLIKGYFDLRRRPMVQSYVYFPGPEFLIDVPFLVDTGAEVTTLSGSTLGELDAGRFERLTKVLTPATNVTGVGGSLSRFVTDALLVLAHEDGQRTAVSLK